MGEIRATVFIRANTEYATFDWLNDDRRVVGLEFDGLTIQIAGWDDRDASIIAATGALIDQLDKLRTAATERIAAIEGTFAGSRCCGAGGSTPHWVECPERTVVASGARDRLSGIEQYQVESR